MTVTFTKARLLQAIREAGNVEIEDDYPIWMLPNQMTAALVWYFINDVRTASGNLDVLREGFCRLRDSESCTLIFDEPSGDFNLPVDPEHPLLSIYRNTARSVLEHKNGVARTRTLFINPTLFTQLEGLLTQLAKACPQLDVLHGQYLQYLKEEE